VGKHLEHFAHRALEDGMPHLGRNLGQRFEDESPFVHRHVRHI
jgi:hypothetical protein